MNRAIRHDLRPRAALCVFTRQYDALRPRQNIRQCMTISRIIHFLPGKDGWANHPYSQ